MALRIEDYALLGDLQTAALVGRDGSVDWLCLPRFDSPACFAALLHDPSAGRWRLAPQGATTCTRRQYRGDSLVLETEWELAGGTVRVIDFMPPRGRNADLVRIVEGVAGSVEVECELLLRFDYGHVVPWVRTVGEDLVAVAGPDAIWLRTPVELSGRDLTTIASFTVHQGDRVPFVLTHGTSYEHRPRPVSAERALAETVGFWAEWIASCDYDGEWQQPVRRSLLTLKALTYAPSGGIVAAATTSLPEAVGGGRNWDYRYCWLRDATLTLQALVGTGYLTEAKAWRDWLLRAAAGNPADLQIMYGVDGRRRLPEYELPWLDGYERSAPVRVGNGAATQFQLDVWGEVLDGLHSAREAGLASLEEAWGLQRAIVGYLEDHWQEPDNSLWEVRGSQRHFTHSKVMAWAGVDRMIQAAEAGVPGPLDRWRALREQIRAEVLEKGYDARRGTFVQHYGGTGVDAALLLLPRVGFLPWDDDRVRGTVETIERELTSDGLVLRYRTDADAPAGATLDGLAGGEGVFLACSFWLADALHGLGRTADAKALFERLLSLRNDVGLLSEEWDTAGHRQVGNTPQAFSHVGLVNTARRLAGH